MRDTCLAIFIYGLMLALILLVLLFCQAFLSVSVDEPDRNLTIMPPQKELSVAHDAFLVVFTALVAVCVLFGLSVVACSLDWNDLFNLFPWRRKHFLKTMTTQFDVKPNLRKKYFWFLVCLKRKGFVLPKDMKILLWEYLQRDRVIIPVNGKISMTSYGVDRFRTRCYYIFNTSDWKVEFVMRVNNDLENVVLVQKGQEKERIPFKYEHSRNFRELLRSNAFCEITAEEENRKKFRELWSEVMKKIVSENSSKNVKRRGKFKRNQNYDF